MKNMIIELHKIDPLTKELFGKNNIRQIVREYLPKENIEENIEHYERHFMHCLYYYVNWGMYISQSCYKTILGGEKDKLTENYITLLRAGVKAKFLDKIFSFGSLEYNSYLCTETIGDMFFEGEIYKEVLNRFEQGNRGTHGMVEDFEGHLIKKEEGLHLIPQKGDRHVVISDNLLKNFKRL
jgi:hypothetical protein